MSDRHEFIRNTGREIMGRFDIHPKNRVWGPILEHVGLLLGKNRGEMLAADYYVMREIDDIVDGDAPVPAGYDNVAKYIEDKIAFLHTPGATPADRVDRLIQYAEQLSQEEKILLTDERELIFRSMLFDTERIGKFQIFPTAVLNEHFYRCDIQGSGIGALKIFGEDPSKYKYVEPLGVASRIQGNLQDYVRDIKAGYINIPQEDVVRFGMTLEDIKDVNSPKVRAWFAKELDRARDLLEQDRELFPQGKFGLLGRVFVDLYIRRPAVKYFKTLSLSLSSSNPQLFF